MATEIKPGTLALIRERATARYNTFNYAANVAPGDVRALLSHLDALEVRRSKITEEAREECAALCDRLDDCNPAYIAQRIRDNQFD